MEETSDLSSTYTITKTPCPAGPIWEKGIPEIQKASRLNDIPDVLIKYNDSQSYETDIYAADSSFLKIFSFPLLLGSVEGVLSDPHSILLTESLKEKYFGSENPMGKTLQLDNKLFTVTGVLKDLPANTIFNFSALVPFSYLSEIGEYYPDWSTNSIFTYLLLRKNTSIDEAKLKMTEILQEHLNESMTEVILLPLVEIHLNRNGESGRAITSVFILGSIAFLILVGLSLC